MPFYGPDFHITVVDPHRPGHEISYYPGQNNLLMADCIVINKIDSADPENVSYVRENIRKYNPNAIVIDAASPIEVDKPELIRGKRVLVVEDGPTLTHGEMTYGAGVVAAEKYGAAELVDPRPYTVQSISGYVYRSIRISARCFRRWDTATSRSRILRRPSIGPSATWS